MNHPTNMRLSPISLRQKAMLVPSHLKPPLDCILGRVSELGVHPQPAKYYIDLICSILVDFWPYILRPQIPHKPVITSCEWTDLEKCLWKAFKPTLVRGSFFFR